jgi:hypothetical protein
VHRYVHNTWEIAEKIEYDLGLDLDRLTALRFTNLPVWGQMRPDSARESGQAVRRDKNQNNQALPFWVAR